MSTRNYLRLMLFRPCKADIIKGVVEVALWSGLLYFSET
jgi:hypothetical protein